MRMVLILCAVVTTAGCQINIRPSPVDTSKIIYFMDHRPRPPICYAAINSLTDGLIEATSITAVSCDAVRDLLQK